MTRTRIAIVGAAGRYFHDYATVFGGDDRCEVVASTHTGAQKIDEPEELPDRRYRVGSRTAPVRRRAP